jgi:hypothetical protein
MFKLILGLTLLFTPAVIFGGYHHHVHAPVYNHGLYHSYHVAPRIYYYQGDPYLVPMPKYQIYRFNRNFDPYPRYRPYYVFPRYYPR